VSAKILLRDRPDPLPKDDWLSVYKELTERKHSLPKYLVIAKPRRWGKTRLVQEIYSIWEQKIMVVCPARATALDLMKREINVNKEDILILGQAQPGPISRPDILLFDDCTEEDVGIILPIYPFTKGILLWTPR
jgi:hypothetical protein